MGTGSRFCDLASALIGSQKQVRSISTLNLRTTSLRFPARCRRASLFVQVRTYSSHEKFWPTSEKCLCFQIRFLFPLIFTLQVTGCGQYGSNFVDPSNPTFFLFQMICHLVVTHVTGSANCKNSTVFCHEVLYCPTPNVVRIPASMQNLIARSYCDNFSTRSWYLCNRSSCAGSSVKGMCVFITLGTKQWVRLSCQHKYHRSCLASFVFIPHTNLRLLREIQSWLTEIIVPVFPSAQKLIDNCPSPLLLSTPLDNWLKARKTGRVSPSSFPPLCPIYLLHW